MSHIKRLQELANINDITYKGLVITKDQINDMREWLKDLNFADIEEEELDDTINELSDIKIAKLVDKLWDGGLKDFIK